jgi:pimeloyl-ACP methyl ester carboxylesterase
MGIAQQAAVRPGDRRLLRLFLVFAMLLGAGVVWPQAAEASSIERVGTDASAAESLAQAMIRDQTILRGARFDAVPPRSGAGVATGSLSYFPTAGDSFALLTTGDPRLANTPNSSGSSGENLGGGNVRGNTDYDVTVLALDLRAPSNTNCLRFDFAFYSEEFPEYVGSSYNDAFIAELNRSTWTTNGSTIHAPDNFAFDPDGQVISINSTGATSMSALNAAGTTYDGATVLLQAATPVTPGEHTLYLSIFDQGDQVYDSAAFVDNLRFEWASSASECREGAVPAGRLPVVFLHGITGAKLNNIDGEVWPAAGKTFFSPGDAHLNSLRLAADGINPLHPDDPEYEISVGEIIPEIAGQDVYKSMLDAIEDAGYVRGETFFPFAFDWRLSAERNGRQLADRIDEILQATGAPQVNIVAHSQGGLVTRAALDRQQTVDKVNRAVTLGTPYLGAANSLGILHYQEPCQSVEILGGCVLNRGKAQELVTNWPGGLELLPSRAYHQAAGSPVVVEHDGGVARGALTFDQVQEHLSGHNDALITQAGEFHDRLDRFTPADADVELMRIVGTGLSTRSAIREFETEQCTLRFFNCRTVQDFEFLFGTGDKTVLKESANLFNPDRSFDFRGTGRNVYAHGVGHGDLPKDRRVRDFVLSWIAADARLAANAEGMTATDAGPIINRETGEPMPSSAPTATTAFLDDDLVLPPGLSEEPTSFSATQVIVTGAVDGAVSDSAHRQTGATDPETMATSLDIPGSDYHLGILHRSYMLNADGDYVGRWTATEDGEVQVVVRSYVDDEVAEVVVFPGVHVAAGSVLELAFARPADDRLALTVDDGGEAAVRLIEPVGTVTGAGADDTVPPSSTASLRWFVDPVGQQVVEVTLDATDTGGAGVAMIEYAHDSDTSVHTYTGPFVLPADGLLHVRATDNAGNVETPYLTVDLANRDGGWQQVTQFLAAHLNAAGRIEHAGDVDWWGLELEAGTHQFQLIGLPADYDLSLHGPAGELITSSTLEGTRSEKIVQTVAAGRYFLRVAGKGPAHDATQQYRLNVTRLGRP